MARTVKTRMASKRSQAVSGQQTLFLYLKRRKPKEEDSFADTTNDESLESASDFQVEEEDQNQIIQQQSQVVLVVLLLLMKVMEVVPTLPSNATSQHHAVLSDLAERDKMPVQPCRSSVKFPPTIVGSKRRNF